MYRPGHYGVALLAYAPVGAALLAFGWRGAAPAGGAVVLVLTPLPDYDHRAPLVEHRGVTHTVGFALVVGGALAAAAFALGDGALTAGPVRRVALAAFAFLLGVLAVVAHIVADALTPAGVRPLWPVSGRRYSLGLVRADDFLANYLLLAAGLCAAAGAALLAGAPG